MPRRANRRDLTAALSALRKELRRCRREVGNLHNENEILSEPAQPLIYGVVTSFHTPLLYIAVDIRSCQAVRDSVGVR